MRYLNLKNALLFALSAPVALGSSVSSPAPDASGQHAGLSDNGYTKLIQWDKYSLVIKGQRTFIHAAEFHPFRLPVPDLWPDILQKFKAAGLNTVSIYIHWYMSNPSKGVLDFDGIRSLQTFMDMAKDAGLWVLFRPGPYINAETTAGGIPHWVTAEVPGYLRSNSSSYTDAYLPYWTYIAKFTAKNQITAGGPIIGIQPENEYLQSDEPGNPGKAGYLEDLQKVLRKEGVLIPTTFNDPGPGNNFASGQGKVDLYGFDSYTEGFNCTQPELWYPVPTGLWDYHMNTNPDQPLFMPEFQSGSLDPWGPVAPGYDACRKLFGPEYESVWNLNLWASNFKMISFYMGYGGTSWGHIPFHKVYTSYDYGAAITETRQLTSKYDELKRQGLFLRSAHEFAATDVKGNSTNGTVVVSGGPVFVSWLQNPFSKSSFYIARHEDSRTDAVVPFKLMVSTSLGNLDLPLSKSSSGIVLNGRQSRVIVTDFAFGSSRALYSTASILFAGKIGARDVLYVYGDPGSEHEVALKFRSSRQSLKKTISTGGSDVVQLVDGPSGYTIVKFKPTDLSGITLLSEADTLVIISSAKVAGKVWSPILGGSGTYGEYWQLGSNSTVLVHGPYLVRSASLSGKRLEIVGDIEENSTISVVGPPGDVKTITFNGKELELSSSGLASVAGVFTTKLVLTPEAKNVKVPDLTSNWLYLDSLPEIVVGYSDKTWTPANKNETNSPFKPYLGDDGGPVLYGCDYGFCEGQVLWRGRFKASGKETAVNLTINGGEGFAASVWLNGKFLKTTYGHSSYPPYIWPITDPAALDPAIEETVETYTFPPYSLFSGKENILTVLQDNMGLNETTDWRAEASKSPRGIRGYKLLGDSTSFTSWKVQGKVGGYQSFPDKTRGVLNEGGLFAERAGYHLPGLPTSVTKSWVSRSPSQGLASGSAGVGFYRKDFTLDVPKGLDVGLSFVFTGGSNKHWRATLWINGWLMGRVDGLWGPQAKFPVHEGILDYRGKNTIAVAIWSMEDAPTSVNIGMEVDSVVQGGVGRITVVGKGANWAKRIEG